MKTRANILQRPTLLAQSICGAYLTEEDTAVDCTCGRGHDTLFLAQRCRRVYSFDLQEEALSSAQKLLAEAGLAHKVEFICDSHAHAARYVTEQPAVIMFNLGYLPGGDKTLTTTAEETVRAVRAALTLLRPGGLISLTMYPGHEEGRREQEQLCRLARELPADRFHCLLADMLNQSETAPRVLLITRKK